MSSKNQDPMTQQEPSAKIQALKRDLFLNFENWNLFGSCFLVIGNFGA